MPNRSKSNQWIGVAAAGLALYHLVTHWNWVSAATRRFFGKTSGRSRLYYALDAALLAGFAAIAATGLVISTWLDLPLDNYDIWLAVHIGVSIGTLAVTALKLVLHWRWIVTAGKGLFERPIPLRSSRQAAGARPINRRAFLAVMGAIGVPSALALTQAARALQHPLEAASEAAPEAAPAENVFDPVVVFAADDTSADEFESAGQIAGVPATPALTADAATASAPSAAGAPATATPTATVTAAATATVAPTATASAPAVSCTIRCRKGCSFPGRCRKYVDNNGNNKCDLGECL